MSQQAELSPESLSNISRVDLVKNPLKTNPSTKVAENLIPHDDSLFIKSFFADDRMNLNYWGISKEALARDMATALDTEYFGLTAPIILMEPPNKFNADFAHPPDEVDMVVEQEPFRVGNVVAVGQDEETDNTFVIAELNEKFGKTDEERKKIRRAMEVLRNGEALFVSPSIRAQSEFHTSRGVVVNRFKVNHLAIVKDPAYGTEAQIRATCSGTPDSCITNLSNVQASLETANPSVPSDTESSFKVMRCDKTGDKFVELNLTSRLAETLIELQKENQEATQEELLTKALQKIATDGPKESLKTKNTNAEVTMADDDNPKTKEELEQAKKQAKKATEEVDKKDEELQQARKANEELTQKVDEMENVVASLTAQTKKPLVESILSAKKDLGIEVKDLNAASEGLMKKSVDELTEMSNDFSAALAAKPKDSNQDIRFAYSAAKTDEERENDVLSKIRSRIA